MPEIQKNASRAHARLAFLMEAGGIEPPSQDLTDVGLYMHSRWFDLDSNDGHRHPSLKSSRLYLIP